MSESEGENSETRHLTKPGKTESLIEKPKVKVSKTTLAAETECPSFSRGAKCSEIQAQTFI